MTSMCVCALFLSYMYMYISGICNAYTHNAHTYIHLIIMITTHTCTKPDGILVYFIDERVQTAL
jgi:hypothetical protein